MVHIVPFGRGSLKNTFAPANSHLTYWGGPIISQIHVVAVFWGPNVDAGVTGGIGQFFTDITSSRFYDLLTEYSTTGIIGAGVPAVSSNQALVRGVFDTAVTITPALCPGPTACALTDTQIQTELAAQITANHVPQPVNDATGNVETFYMIYFPPGVTISATPTIKSCQAGGFCAYHSNLTTNVPYGVLPDFGPTSGCISPHCGSGTTFQNVTAVTSHEMSEAVTDVLVSSATNFAAPLAWYDPAPGHAEIGDICNGQDALVNAGGNSYAVQLEFSNVQNDCVGAPPVFNLAAPATSFLTVPFNVTLTVQSSLNPSALAGYTGTVHFTSSDPQAVLPADYTFVTADAGTHTFSVTLPTLGSQTITVQDTHAAGFTGNTTTSVSNTPDLTISKSHTGNFTVGQVGAAYTITVSNAGGGPTSGTVTVTDNLPAGLSATAISGAGWTCVLGTLTCTRTDALPLSTSYPAITLTVNVGGNAPVQVTNTAAVSGGGEANTANDTASDLTNINAPDLIVIKFHAGAINGSFFQGETGATYTLDVINNGNASTLAPVSVVDTLPTGLTATAISGTGWTCTLVNLTCTRSDALAAGANYPFITVTVDVALNAPANVTNTATVSGGGETNTTNDLALDLTFVLPPPTTDLSISVFNPFNFVQGQPGTYTIGVFNVGTLDSSGTVTVTDTLPAGLTATSMSGTGWNCNLLSLTCTRNDVLAFGSSYPSITLNVNVAANAASVVTNTVTISGGGDANPANNSASAQTQIAPPLVDLVMQFSSPTGFYQGQTGGTITLFISNAGNIPSSGTVTVTDALPTGMTATAMSGTGWSCTLSSVTCTRSDALPSTGPAYPNIVLTVDVAKNAPAQLTNTATLTGGGDGNPSNNVASIPFPITPAVQLAVVGPATASAAAGQSSTFSFQVATTASTGVVTFACSGLPTGAACSFSPSSIGPVPSITPVNVVISTTARTASVFGWRFDQTPQAPSKPVLLLLLGTMAAIAFVRRQRPRRRWAVGVASLLLVAVLVGCGGGSTPQVVQNSNGTPPGTFAITVSATGATTGSATQVFTLTVR